MNFTWGDLLQLADALAKQPNVPGPEEAALRAAISRSYYAAFCAARDLAVGRREIPITFGTGVHQLVINHFQESTDVSRRQIGADLDRLRKWRNNADYDQRLHGKPASRAMASVSAARNVLDALAKLGNQGA